MGNQLFLQVCILILILPAAAIAGREINCATDFNSCNGLVAYWKMNSKTDMAPLSTSEAVATGMLGLWHMDESGGNLADSTGHGYTATRVGPDGGYSQPGMFGTSIQPNMGEGNKCFVVPDSDSVDFGTGAGKGWTVSYWHYMQSHPQDCRVLPFFSKGYDYISILGAGTNCDQLQFRTGSGDACATFQTPRPAAGAWHHVIAVMNQTGVTSGTKKIFIDGSLITNCAYSTKETANTENLVFGCSAGGYTFGGRMDEYAIWNRALSDGEAEVVYYRNVTPDSKGSNTGLLRGPTMSTGKLDGAFSFDGVNDKITIPTGANLNSAQFTISMWFYVSAISRTHHVLAAQRQAGCGSINWQLYAVVNPACGGNIIYFDGCTGINTPVGSWTHIAAVANGTHKIVYINGTQAYSAVGTVGTNLFPTTIGDETCGNYFNGKIDDVTYWNRALSSTEIRQLAIIGGIPLNSTTEFTVARGTTDFAAVSNLSNVSQPKLANTHGSVQWTNTVNVANQDFDANVRIGSGYISINKSALHSSVDAPATVSVSVAGCTNLTLYYATGFRNSIAEIKANGQQCNAGSNPSCTNIQCAGTTATFTVQHFDSYGGEGGGGSTPQGGSDGVPEFSSITILIAAVAVITGFFFIRRQDR